MMPRLLSVLALLTLLAAAVSGCSVSIGVPPPPPPAGYVRLTSVDSVYIRACPSTSCDVRTVVYRGQAVQVWEYDANGWARVTLVDSGATGWMYARYLALPR
jgi:uncharacterized protein YgiM (DUF1202 family)